MPEVEVVDNTEEDRFEARIGGELAGYMTYRRRPELIEINHTEVFKSFEGQGVGGALARQSLDRVRGEGLAVLPFCPFLAGWIGKHEAYLDLVPEGSRARFGLA